MGQLVRQRVQLPPSRQYSLARPVDQSDPDGLMDHAGQSLPHHRLILFRLEVQLVHQPDLLRLFLLEVQSGQFVPLDQWDRPQVQLDLWDQ